VIAQTSARTSHVVTLADEVIGGWW